MQTCPDCGGSLIRSSDHPEKLACSKCNWFWDADEMSDEVSHIVSDGGELKLVILGDQTLEEIQTILTLSELAEAMRDEDDIVPVKLKADYEIAMQKLIIWLWKNRRDQIRAVQGIYP